MADVLKSIERRAYRQAFEDGLTEILVGIVVGGAGLALRGKFGGLLGPAAIFLLVPLHRRLRERVTVPRTGFSQMRVEGGKLLAGIAKYTAVVLAAGALLMALTGSNPAEGRQWYRWMPALAGAVIAGGFIHAGSTSGLKRFWIYTAAAIGGGLALTLTAAEGRAEAYERLRYLLIGLSLLLAGIGLINMARFLHRNPVASATVPREVADGR